MHINIKNELTAIFPQLDKFWEMIHPFLQHRIIPAKTILLREGDISETLYIVIKGCLRLYFIRPDGNEFTSQFFFEHQMVSSIESFFTGKSTRLYLESLEETELVAINGADLEKILTIDESFKNWMLLYLRDRLIYYTRLHSSFILDTPEQRYVKLKEEYPFIVDRIPLHYIASYLGITPVSLSRIRSRIKK